MQVLIAYDIVKNKTRTHVHRYLSEKGMNTQKSIFECEIDDLYLSKVVQDLKIFIDHNTDSVRFYPMCRRCIGKVRIIGQGLLVYDSTYEIC